MAMSVVYTTIDRVLVHEDRGGVERQYVGDPLGSLVGELDENQNLTYTAEYWPYGEVRTESGSKQSEWGYVGLLGYLTDLATLLYVRARHYLPHRARWLIVDPLWPEERAYEYSYCSPLTQFDPFGRQPSGCPIHGGVPGCRFDGPPGSESDPAYWHCRTDSLHAPPSFNFWTDPWWGYGRCCGPGRVCSPGSKTFSCTDEACKKHDLCVGPSWTGLVIWLLCNRKFCNDIKYCWNRNCSKFPVDWKQCTAISDIARVFCNSFGGMPPPEGNRWR